MKKVAIITITNSGLNYGNRLQNYALQEKIKQYGVQVETIFSANDCKNSLLISRLRRLIKKVVKTSGRRRYFARFDKLYIKGSKRIHYGKLNEAAFSNEYDAFIAGSDQVWNPYFHFNSEFEFMTFADPKKRYSYAASLGVDSISEEYKARYTMWLQQMNQISVREESGKELVKNLSGKDAFVHVDPTMLLDKVDYKKIQEKPPMKLPKKYLLMYYLGKKSEEYLDYIKQVAKKENLEIVELSETVDSKFYHMGPQHFLYVVHHADYICTDSFHGTVFSILFEKRFTVFGRQDNDVPMNDRIRTLLDKTQLTNRLLGSLSIEESLVYMDYKEVNQRLMEEREKAEEYLLEISGLW